MAERLKSTLPYQLVDRRCLNAHTNIDLSRTIDDLELAADHVLLQITPDATTAAIPQVKRLESWPVSRRNAWLKQTLTAANACTLNRMPAPVQ